MTLEVEMVVDGGMRGEEALRRAWGYETAVLPLSTTRRLVRDLGKVIRPCARHLAISQPQIAQSRAIGSQSIGHDGARHVSLPFQQPPQELEGGLLIAA